MVALKMIKDLPFLSLQSSFGQPDIEIVSLTLEVMVASEIYFKPLSEVKPMLFSSTEISETYDHFSEPPLRRSLYFGPKWITNEFDKLFEINLTNR